jgi:ADP-heptose:LPS heptosyltransferase
MWLVTTGRSGRRRNPGIERRTPPHVFSHAREQKSIDRVAVVRALQLGDLLCAVPAFRALRTAFPPAHISLIGLPWAQQLIDHLPGYIDELIEFPGFPGLPEAQFDPAAFGAFLRDMQDRRFDLAVQLHGSGLNSNALAHLLGARQTIGSYPPGSWNPDPQTHVQYTGHGSEVARCLAPLEHVGISPVGEALEFTLTPDDHAQMATLSDLQPLIGRPYVCLHGGARHGLRRWPVEDFIEVGRALAADGWPIVLTGTSEEAPVTRAIAAAVDGTVVDLAGRTTIGSLAAVLASSRLLVANDTGVAHLADALGVPSVIVFTHTDPERWAAADRSLHRVVARQVQHGGCRHDGGKAHRCLADACTLSDRSGVEPIVGEIPVELVMREIDDVLRSREPRESAHVA